MRDRASRGSKNERKKIDSHPVPTAVASSFGTRASTSSEIYDEKVSEASKAREKNIARDEKKIERVDVKKTHQAGISAGIWKSVSLHHPQIALVA